MTLSEIEAQLSIAAKVTLRSGSDRIGAKRAPLQPVREELVKAKLLGTNDGLTIKGSALAARLAYAHERELFPL